MRVVLIFVGVIDSWPVEESGEGRPGPVGTEDELMRWDMAVKRGAAAKKMSTPTRRKVTRVAIRQVAVRRPEPARVGRDWIG